MDEVVVHDERPKMEKASKARPWPSSDDSVP